MFRSLLLVLCISLGLAARDTMVVLLRHAEKTHKGDTAQLSEAGLRRAACLPPQLMPYQPDALFASNLERTQQTLAPLSKALSIPVQIYARGEERALGQQIMTRYSGKTVVVCGHSDTLVMLVEALGYRAPFAEISGFDHYWLLRVVEGSGTVTLQELQQKPVPSPILEANPALRE